MSSLGNIIGTVARDILQPTGSQQVQQSQQSQPGLTSLVQKIVYPLLLAPPGSNPPGTDLGQFKPLIGGVFIDKNLNNGEYSCSCALTEAKNLQGVQIPPPQTTQYQGQIVPPSLGIPQDIYSSTTTVTAQIPIVPTTKTPSYPGFQIPTLQVPSFQPSQTTPGGLGPIIPVSTRAGAGAGSGTGVIPNIVPNPDYNYPSQSSQPSSQTPSQPSSQSGKVIINIVPNPDYNYSLQQSSQTPSQQPSPAGRVISNIVPNADYNYISQLGGNQSRLSNLTSSSSRSPGSLGQIALDNFVKSMEPQVKALSPYINDDDIDEILLIIWGSMSVNEQGQYANSTI